MEYLIIAVLVLQLSSFVLSAYAIFFKYQSTETIINQPTMRIVVEEEVVVRQLGDLIEERVEAKLRELVDHPDWNKRATDGRPDKRKTDK